MAIGGVDFIIQLSVPVLCILYPITIVLILFNVFGLENELAYKAGVYITLLISIVETLGVTFKIGAFTNAVQLIPLGKDGFAWLVILYPITIVLILFNVFGLENELAYKAGVYITLLISIVETLGVTFKIGAFTNAVQLIPLGKDGFAWLVPCVIVTAVAFAFSRKATK